MSALLNPPQSRCTVSVLLGRELAVADDLLQTLRVAGFAVNGWSLSAFEEPGSLRLTMDVTGDADALARELALFRGMVEWEVHMPGGAAHIELALVTVRAQGELQDEAAEIVSAAGGMLMSLEKAGFTAQVTNRPVAIDAMIKRLRLSASIEVVRSGGLPIRPI